MRLAATTEPEVQVWEQVSTIPRAEPGEKRVLIKIEAGRT
jgi:NADPH:quinone reductase-like Zn-dependent oxidoreductase